MWSVMADLENETVDEEPLFAGDLDEYEGQDEEDDPPPLPPPIQGTQSNPLSRLNNNNTVQTICTGISISHGYPGSGTLCLQISIF